MASGEENNNVMYVEEDNEPSVQVSFRVPKKMIDEVDNLCYTTIDGVLQKIGDRSAMLRLFIAEGLERRKKAIPIS